MDYKKVIAQRIKEVTGIDEEKVKNLIEIPPRVDMGDFSFPCFILAKELKKAPPVIANEIAEKIEKEGFEEIKTIGPYLNFFLKKGDYVKDVVTDVLNKGKDYGKSGSGQKRTVLIEYSSPNVAKPFSVALMFTTALGNSLYRLHKFEDYDAVGINHLGDYGTQFGKQIYAYETWGDAEALEKDPIKELLRTYVKFHKEAEEDPTLVDKGREYFRLLEEGNEYQVKLWEKFRELSIKEFNKIYDRLNIKFDSIRGEAFYSSIMDEVVSLIKEKGLLEDSQGAQVVKLDEYNMPPAIVLKSDNSSIYTTRDLTAAIFRKKTYDFYKNLYVVGAPQALHFKQVFKVLELLGFPWAKDCVHIGFGLVRFQGMKFSTREGNIFYLEDLLNSAKETVLEIIGEKNPDLENKEEIAEKIGLGGIIFMYLKNSKDKDINFVLEDVLNFEGETGPYVQYTYARGKSILRKYQEENNGEVNLSLLKEVEEFELAKILSGFNDAVLSAIDKYEPCMVTRYVLEVAKTFNKFYNNINIGNSEGEVKKARLKLVEASCIVIANALELLGIEVVERM